MTRAELEKWSVQVVQDSRVQAAVRTVGRNPERVQEALQEAVCRALEVHQRGGFQGEWDYNRFACWIIVTARNYLVTVHRRCDRQQPVADLGAVSDRATDEESEERREAVRRVLIALPDAARVLLRLRFEEGLTLEELAARLGCRLTAAWRLLRKPIARVRACLLRDSAESFAWLEAWRMRRERSSPPETGEEL